jgi:hypothetical protein
MGKLKGVSRGLWFISLNEHQSNVKHISQAKILLSRGCFVTGFGTQFSGQKRALVLLAASGFTSGRYKWLRKTTNKSFDFDNVFEGRLSQPTYPTYSCLATKEKHVRAKNHLIHFIALSCHSWLAVFALASSSQTCPHRVAQWKWQNQEPTKKSNLVNFRKFSFQFSVSFRDPLACKVLWQLFPCLLGNTTSRCHFGFIWEQHES